MKKLFISLMVMIICLGWIVSGFSAANAASKESDPKGKTIYWYERDVKKYAWMALDEVAVFMKKTPNKSESREVLQRMFHPQAQVADEADSVILGCPANAPRLTDTSYLCYIWLHNVESAIL